MNKKVITILLAGIFILGGIIAVAENNSISNMYKGLNEEKVKDTTVVAKFNDIEITAENVYNSKLEIETMNKELNGLDITITEGEIIKNKLMNHFLLLEAEKEGIVPISDEEAQKAKEEQIYLYEISSDRDREFVDAKIEDLGYTFDEYYNDFFVDYYKDMVMVSDYLKLASEKYIKEKGVTDKTEGEIHDLIREEVYNKYKDQIILNKKYSITLP